MYAVPLTLETLNILFKPYILGFLYSTKRNHETKSLNEMTKSVNDNTGFGVVGIVQIFISHKMGQQVGYRMVPGCHICSLLLFSRFKPCQYTRGKTHTVTVIMQRDLVLIKTSN